MTHGTPSPQASAPATPDVEPWDDQARGRPLLIFDGDCGFCTRSAEWLRDHRKRPLSIAPWQFIEYRGPGLESLGLAAADFERYAWWVGDSEAVERGHRAISRSLAACGGVWPLIGWLLRVPPVSWLAALGYRIVSRYRHRMPGGTPACRL